MRVNPTALLGFATLLFTGSFTAQQPEQPLSKLRRLGLEEVPGSIPAIFVPAAKERAVRFQKSLEDACTWYEQQLHVHVDVALAVLDEDAYQKYSGHAYMPYNVPVREGQLVIVPDSRKPQTPPAGAMQPAGGPDSEHSPGGILQGEQTLFHESGHLVARALKIESANFSMNELVPQILSTAYMRAKRPDLKWMFEIRSGATSISPRYTSLADLDYLEGMDIPNYNWFQGRLLRLADFVLTGQGFPIVIEKLKAAFPASGVQQETIEQLKAHLDTIKAGYIDVAPPIFGPSTITRISPITCPKPQEKSGPRSPIIVRNDTAEPVSIGTPDGRTTKTLPHTWRVYFPIVGLPLKLSDGMCLVGREEATLAIVEKNPG